MKFSLNDKEIFSLSPMQVKILADYMPREILDEDLRRRVHWIIREQLLKEAAKKMRGEWEGALVAEGLKAIPVSDEEFASLVVSRIEYLDASQRKAKEEARRTSNAKVV